MEKVLYEEFLSYLNLKMILKYWLPVLNVAAVFGSVSFFLVDGKQDAVSSRSAFYVSDETL